MLWQPVCPRNQSSPAATGTNREYNDEGLVQFTQVPSNKAVNEIRVGEAIFGLSNENLTTWSNHWQAANGINTGSPRITFTGFSIGGNQNYPRHQDQWVWNVRDDFTYSYDATGRHDLQSAASSCIAIRSRTTAGSAWARSTPRRRRRLPANLVSAVSRIRSTPTRGTSRRSRRSRGRYNIGVGDFNVHLYSKKVASWVQDDWQISNRMTLNLGLRYDLEIGAFANDVNFPPFQSAGRPNDKMNFQPRLGFNYKVNDKTVVRGGAGLYYGDAIGADQSFASGNPQMVVISTPMTAGRTSRPTRPTGSRCRPTRRRSRSGSATPNNNAPGTACIRDLQEFTALPQYVHLPRTQQVSIGFAAAVRPTRSAVRRRLHLLQGHAREGRHRQHQPDVRSDHRRQPPVRESRHPAVPGLGRRLDERATWASSAYHALQTSFNKRFSQHWQASATYTLSWLWSADTQPVQRSQPGAVRRRCPTSAVNGASRPTTSAIAWC